MLRGGRLIIEPVLKKLTLTELLAAWRERPPIAPGDDFPDVEDAPAVPEDIF